MFLGGDLPPQLPELLEEAAPYGLPGAAHPVHRGLLEQVRRADGQAVHLFLAGDDRLRPVGQLQHRVFPALPEEPAVGGIAVQRALDVLRLPVRELAVGGAPVELPRQNGLAPAPPEDIGDHRRAEHFSRGLHGAEYQRRLVGNAHPAPGGVAVAAVAAALLRLFPEVPEDVIAEASRGAAVVLHAGEALIVEGRLVAVPGAPLDEEALDGRILPAVEEDAFRRRAVAPGPARFLIVGLEALRHLVVQHIAHVALVDAHTEGVRRRHDRRPGIGEILLRGLPLLVGQPRMVPSGAEARIPEKLIHLVHRFPGGAVHDAAFPRMGRHVFPDEFLLVRAAHHSEGQIRPVQPGAEDPRAPEAQTLLHVLLHHGRGRRGEGRHHRPLGQGADEIVDAAVAWPEVMPPLGHAVRLVHHKKGERHLTQAFRKIGRLQFFRRHVEQLQPPRVEVAQTLDGLRRRHRAVHVGRRHALAGEGLHLILHEGDERRDDHRPRGQRQRRHLETYRFPRAGGHDGQHVLSGQDRADDLLLHRAEAVVAEIFLQDIRRLHVLPPFPIKTQFILYRIMSSAAPSPVPREKAGTD